jgi:hypothetical protein
MLSIRLVWVADGRAVACAKQTEHLPDALCYRRPGDLIRLIVSLPVSLWLCTVADETLFGVAGSQGKQKRVKFAENNSICYMAKELLN